MNPGIGMLLHLLVQLVSLETVDKAKRPIIYKTRLGEMVYNEHTDRATKKS